MKSTILLRLCAATLLTATFLLPARPAEATTTGAAPSQSFSRELNRAAAELDAAAAHLRYNPHGKVAIPNLRLPPAPLGGTPMYSPSLDQWLQSGLAQVRQEKSGKARERAMRELASSLRLAASASPATAPALDPASETAKILAQRAFQTGGGGAAPAPKETLWQRFLRWLGELFAKLFSGIFGAAASTPIIGQVVAVIFVLLIASVAAYLIYLLATSLNSRRRPQSLDEGTPLQEHVDPDILYQAGLAAAGAGHYAQAIALLFQASLTSLDRKGLLEFDASRTAGEYRRAVKRTLASASPHFDAIAHAFILAAFSEKRISENDWSTADAAYRSLQPLLAS